MKRRACMPQRDGAQGGSLAAGSTTSTADADNASHTKAALYRPWWAMVIVSAAIIPFLFFYKFYFPQSAARICPPARHLSSWLCEARLDRHGGVAVRKPGTGQLCVHHRCVGLGGCSAPVHLRVQESTRLQREEPAPVRFRCRVSV